MRQAYEPPMSQYLTRRVLPEKSQKRWTSPIYAFYKPTVVVGEHKGRPAQLFTCAAKGCTAKGPLARYMDTNDKSTGNLHKHATACWGHEAVAQAMLAKDADEVRKTIIKSLVQTGSITALFERKKGSKVTYSHRQHTRAETRYVAVRNLP